MENSLASRNRARSGFCVVFITDVFLGLETTPLTHVDSLCEFKADERRDLGRGEVTAEAEIYVSGVCHEGRHRPQIYGICGGVDKMMLRDGPPLYGPPLH